MRKTSIVLWILVMLTSFCLGPAHAGKGNYYCPMHPAYTSDKLGTCPICNMSLVKNKKDKSAGLTQEEQVKKHLADICLMYNCHKFHDGRPCPMMVVTKKGEKVNCPICGTHVAGYPEKGQTNTANVSIKLDERKRQLIGVKTASVSQKSVIKTIRTYGKVTRDPRWVSAQVFEYERPFLYIGERPLVGIQHAAEIEIPALPGKKFRGKVRLLDREMDPVTRTTKVRIQLNNWDKSLKPDMSANVVIAVDLGTSLAVPESAVLDTGERQVVFVNQGEGLIEPRTVVLGEKGDAGFEVLKGLREGERVVVEGNFMIDSESRLKAVLESVDAETATAGGHQHGK